MTEIAKKYFRSIDAGQKYCSDNDEPRQKLRSSKPETSFLEPIPYSCLIPEAPAADSEVPFQIKCVYSLPRSKRFPKNPLSCPNYFVLPLQSRSKSVHRSDFEAPASSEVDADSEELEEGLSEMQELCSACGCGSSPRSSRPCKPCTLPPPCAGSKSKCCTATNGYYYYPYGTWVCGPYHVGGLCKVVKGPVCSTSCEPKACPC